MNIRELFPATRSDLVFIFPNMQNKISLNGF